MVGQKNDSQPAARAAESPAGATKRTRVLLVDDDQRLLTALSRGLSLHGFEVDAAKNAGEALVSMEKQRPDVLVLDIMMPGLDGLSLCRIVREKTQTPILMLTARDSIPDRVAGLEAGADDYLIKPFAFDELVARLQALLRRSSARPASNEPLSYRDLVMDRGTWSATRGGEPLMLTAKEFRILECFLKSPERVVTRADILATAWGDEDWSESNVVDVHVASLRQKLEAGGRRRLIQTIRGVGYMLREE